jgi:hypothetical protein
MVGGVDATYVFHPSIRQDVKLLCNVIH